MTKTLAAVAVVALSPLLAAAAGAQTTPAVQAPPADTSAANVAKGRVIGPANEPKAGVPIKIEGPLGQTIATTDKSGTWSLYNLPAGQYKAQMVGADQSKSAAVAFTVKDKSFWEKVAGSKETVWTPEIKLDQH